MNNNSKKQGVEGESLARKYLLEQGYELLEVNWRYKKLEVDIIAKKDETIVFVEVKTRKSAIFGEPEWFVSRKKQGFLQSAAHHYLIEKDFAFESRFDIIAITGFNNNYTVKHLESAFYPQLR